MIEEKVTNLIEFINVIHKSYPNWGYRNYTVFRGQRDFAWDVIPGIARHPFTKDAICQNDKDKSIERQETL